MNEEKKSFFGKIQERIQDYRKAVGQQETLDEKKRRAVDVVNTFVNKGLGDMVSEPVDFNPLNIGDTFGAVARFVTKDNVPIASYITIRSSGSLFYPMDYFFGSFVEQPIPTSIIAKRISTGFARSERVLIPYDTQTRFQFDAKAIWKNRTGWNPLVEMMNKDRQLISALSSLPSQAIVTLSAKMSLTYKIEDEKEKNAECLCQIIPYKNLTFIGIRTLGLAHERQVRNIIDLIRIIREHILGYGHTIQTAGELAQNWMKIPIVLMIDYFPSVKEAFPPEPTVQVAEIDYFGEKRDRALELVKVFNTTQRDEPENWYALVTLRQRLIEIISKDQKTLLEALKSKEAAVKAAAVTALRSYPEPDVMAALKEASESSDSFVACSALESLGSTGKKEVTPSLVRFLNDPIAQKRAVAAFALSQLGNEGAIDALNAALNDADNRVQKIAAFGLLRMRVQQIQEDRIDKAVVEEALKKFFGYLDLEKLASIAKEEAKDVKIDVKDIYPGQLTAELLKLLFRRFFVIVKAHMKTLAGRKEQSFSYLVDAENAEEARSRVVEEFNKEQGSQGFFVDSVDKPLDMTTIGADVSREYPLGVLVRPVWLKSLK